MGTGDSGWLDAPFVVDAVNVALRHPPHFTLDRESPTDVAGHLFEVLQ